MKHIKNILYHSLLVTIFQIILILSFILFIPIKYYTFTIDWFFLFNETSLTPHPWIKLIILSYLGIILINILVLFFISAPLLWLVKNRKFGFNKNLFYYMGSLLSFYILWIWIGAIRYPTLISNKFTTDNENFTWTIYRFFCSYYGITLIILILIATSILILIHSSLKKMLYYQLWLIFISIFIFWPNLNLDLKSNLPENSVIMIMADAWRSDHFSPTTTPMLWNEYLKRSAIKVKTVLPPVEATDPALISLLTGRLPIETKVDNIFVYEKTTHIPSLVSLYRENNYCTIGVSQTDGSIFMNIYDVGFEKVLSPPFQHTFTHIQRILMEHDPFFMVSLSWFNIRRLLPRSLQLNYEGIQTITDYPALFYRFNTLAKACGDRPIFGFMFLNGPHSPFNQEFPFYLNLKWKNGGALRVPSDKTFEWLKYSKHLYKTNLRVMDYYLGNYIKQLYGNDDHLPITLIISSDHGEYLGEDNNYLHGIKLGDPFAGGSPWVVFGRNRQIFSSLPDMVTSMGLSNYILRLNALPETLGSHLDKNFIYSETTINWGFDKGVSNKIDELGLEPCEKYAICLQKEHKEKTRYMKQRRWIYKDNIIYEFKPQKIGEIFLYKNGKRISYPKLPEDIRDFLHKYYSDLVRDIKNP